ncbi:diguanylate cyclase [Sulfurimonas sp. HSL-1716]|uniref:diguanylate cyclase n=1 Tax=Hydrocurvibacter sulfurireducens TaxID=3131937 RepID=UPI0031F81F90
MLKVIIFYILLVFSSLYADNKLQNVTLQLQWKHQFEYAGFYAAEEKGFYKEVGLDVSFKEFKNGMHPVDDVLDTKNAYGITYSDLIVDYLDGKPVVFVANFFKHSPLVLVAQSNIKLPSDLKGKKIMGIENTIKSTAFLMMFKDFGMNLGSFTNVPPSFKIDDFVNKKIDAMVVFSTNELFYLDKACVKYNVFNPSSYGTEFYDVNLFTSRDELINHPRRVENFKNASIRGWQYALTHKEEIIDLILKKYNTQHKSRAALEFEANQIQHAVLPSIFPIGSIDPVRVRMMAEDFKEMGLVSTETALDFSNFIYEDKHYASDLTKEEKSFLISKGPIKMCADPDWMPFEGIKDGRHIGIAADFFNLIRKKSDIKIELYPTKTWQQSVNAAKTRKCDIFSLASSTPSRLKYMQFTDPYIKLPLVLATKMDKPYTYNFYALKDKKIGVVGGYAIGEILRRKYPNMDIVDVKNIHDGLKKVERGELYGYVDNLMVLAYTIQHEFTGLLKISSRVNENVALAIGTRNDEPLLHTIFEKLVHTVSEKEKQEIYNQWVSVEETKEMNYGFIIKLLSVILIISLAFLYHYFRLKKYSAELKRLSVTDSLTGIYNRMKTDDILQYQYDLFSRYKTPCGVIMLDIDHFKEVNDTYGHQTGDYVLQQFAQILKNSIRSTDIAGRWGGEEFLIICPNTNIEQVENVANNIKDKIAAYHFANNVKHLTASFGVSCFGDRKNIDDVIKAADSALYTSKEKGRNQVTKAEI